MKSFINRENSKVTEQNKVPIQNKKPTKELLEALKEGEDILNGTIAAKRYHSVEELINDLDEED